MKTKPFIALSLACSFLSGKLGASAELMPVRTPDDWPTKSWKTAPPQEFGVDTNALAKAIAHVPQICPRLQSLLVVRYGRLITERYFDGTSPGDPWNIKSASKSMISALVGIAIEEGYIRSLDQPAIDFFPEYRDQLDDPRKKEITIQHLLTMTAGLQWSENGPITFRWLDSRDRIGFVWKSKLVANPGSHWNYSTALTHLLSAILTRATGINTLAFARRALFDPLGISVAGWDKDKQNYYVGGSEVFLTPTDMAKFGYLYLNDGRWDGKQIVPEAWVQASTRQTNSAHYGFLWWLDTFEGRPIYFAQGLGGQHIVVVPYLDVVVVTTSYLPTHISALAFIKLWVLPCLTRVDRAASELPSAEQVIERFYKAVGGRERLGGLRSLRIIGQVEVTAADDHGAFEFLKADRGRIFSRFKGTRTLPGEFGTDGTIVWTTWHGPHILPAEQAECWREEAKEWSDLRGPLQGMKTVAIAPRGGRRCYQLQLQRESGEVLTDFYDIESGLLAASTRREVNRYGSLAVTREFSDYRQFGAFKFPARIAIQVQGPEMVLTRTAIEYDCVDPRAFTPPIAIDEILKGKRGRASR